MLDLACQDSSYEKAMGYHEKNKHVVKWVTRKKKFVDVTGQLKRILLRDGKETLTFQRKKIGGIFTEDKNKAFK